MRRTAFLRWAGGDATHGTDNVTETADIAAEAERQRDVIAFLSDPASYGVPSVTMRETHGSIVFLAGDRAYKLKRAVRYPYMDYGTRARRRAMCLAELAVNRRTAPMLYLQVRAIVRDWTHLRFASMDEADGARDFVVVMRRFREDDLLDAMRRDGRLDARLIRQTAETVAAFHEAADSMPGFGGAAGIARVIAENVAAFRAARERPFAQDAIVAYETAAGAALAERTALLERRRRDGRVRRCHGDLHLNNICVIEGKPVPFDGIEFNDDLACIDVLYDLAFLLMDLDRRDLRGFANLLLNRYCEVSGEADGLAAMPLFLSCRAAIRAHVAVAAAHFLAGDDAAAKRAEGADLLARANAYLGPARPRLIAVGGISGTGKSRLARALAPALGVAPGAIVLRSDAIRKRLMGVAETVRLPETAYTPAMNEKVYTALARSARAILATGYAVIADAVYGRAAERDAIAGVARSAGASFDGLWLEAPVPVLEQRISARRGDASDATVAVMHAQRDFVEPPADWRRLDAGQDRSATDAAGRAALGL